MGHESTAINDLIGQVTRKPIRRSGDDWLFGEAAEATDSGPTIDTNNAPAPEHVAGYSIAPTHFVRKAIDWQGMRKYLALPATLFGVVIVLLAIYLLKSPSKHAAEVATTHVEAPRTKPISAPIIAPVVPPPVEAKTPAPPVEAAAPTVTPIEKPVAKTVEPTRTADKVADAAEPAAGRFSAPVEQTITAGHATAPTVAPAVEAKVAAKPVAAAKPAVAAKKVVPKKLARKPVRVAKVAAKRAPPRVADAKPVADEAPAKDGKGVLSIGSTPPLEVWVDGRNSNAPTPLRVILLAGKHKVTLFDKEHGKAHTFEVEIKPNETLKISKSYK